MAMKVVMPKLGMTMKEGIVSTWHKHVGDSVKKGEVVASINSEKIEMDIEAPEDGEILEIAVKENQGVPPGTVICFIGNANEEWKVNEVNSTIGTDKIHTAVNTEQPGTYNFDHISKPKIKITPVAKKMAVAAGLDIYTLNGTGPNGRITKADVERVLSQPVSNPVLGIAANSENSAEQNQQPSLTVGLEDTSIMTEKDSTSMAENPQEVIITPLTGMRKTIASRLSKSLHQTAQLTIFAKADITELKRLKSQLFFQSRNLLSEKVTITDFVAKAVVTSLIKHKEMNSALISGEIYKFDEVHLGIAVSITNGLVVPVVHNAERLAISALAKEIKNLSHRARKGALESEDMQGSTFSITNLGKSGVEYFTPILNAPETGILGVGSAYDAPAYIGDKLMRRSFLPLSLTFDHQVLDGVPAATFLHSVKEHLENPLSLLL